MGTEKLFGFFMIGKKISMRFDVSVVSHTKDTAGRYVKFLSNTKQSKELHVF